LCPGDRGIKSPAEAGWRALAVTFIMRPTICPMARGRCLADVFAACQTAFRVDYSQPALGPACGVSLNWAPGGWADQPKRAGSSPVWPSNCHCPVAYGGLVGPGKNARMSQTDCAADQPNLPAWRRVNLLCRHTPITPFGRVKLARSTGRSRRPLTPLRAELFDAKPPGPKPHCSWHCTG